MREVRPRTATTFQTASIALLRDQAATALAAPAASLTPDQRTKIRNLAVSLSELGNILLLQEDPQCLPHLQEALALAQRIGDSVAEGQPALSLGNAYLYLPGLRDLDQAEHWFRHSLSLLPGRDQLGRAQSLGSLGTVALQRFDDARAAGEAGPVLLDHLKAALSRQRQALDLTPAADHQTRGITENQLGNIYSTIGDTRQALRHYQQAIQHHEARGDVAAAGLTRHDIALLLAGDGRISDALHYARAARHNYQQAGAARDAAEAEQLIADLEQRNG